MFISSFFLSITRYFRWPLGLYGRKLKVENTELDVNSAEDHVCLLTRQKHLLPDFDVVRQQPAVDGFCGVGHERPAFEAGLLEEPGQGSTVIQMEAKDVSHTKTDSLP